jgi:hypothetical protein
MQGVYLVSRRQEDTLRYLGFFSQQRLLGGPLPTPSPYNRFLWAVGVASAGVGEWHGRDRRSFSGAGRAPGKHNKHDRYDDAVPAARH